MSTSAGRAPAKRPGGRTADVTERVQKAVTDLLLEGGVRACTFKAVAQRAEVERSTLYRRYADRWDMMIDALLIIAREEVTPEPADSFPDELGSVLRKLARILETPVGPALLSVAADLRAHSRNDFSRAFFDRRMSQLDPMFEAAIARGDLTADVDREALFTLAAGPIYFRMFIAARGIDDDFIHTVVSSVCWLYCAPSVAAKLSRPARMA